MYQIRFLSKRNNVKPNETETMNVTTVVSPLGVHLPAYVNLEKYFNGLKNQWN